MRQVEALQDIAVVMCTGSIYEGNVARARAVGAVGYVAKPASLLHLRPMIDDLPSLDLFVQDDATHLIYSA